VADTAEQLKLLQSARAKTAQELDSLEVKKKEMELLVRKASLALFLKEQYAHHERQVLEEVAKNKHLKKALDGATESAQKIAALDEEIKVDPNVKQLLEIISAAERRAPTFAEALNDFPPLTRAAFIILRLLNRSVLDVVRIFALKA
jgi:hypothetical protein